MSRAIESLPCLKITGGVPLIGEVHLHGAKNAVLVSMVASILATGTTILRNVPFSSDVLNMAKLLEAFGVTIQSDATLGTLKIDTSCLRYEIAPIECVRSMRASALILGPMLARFGKASMTLPGGCVLGSRPLDLHLYALQKLGAHYIESDGYLTISGSSLQGAIIVFKYPSVGATENALMAAVLAQGKTILCNAALEPEVLSLIDMLSAMGACIRVRPSQEIVIEGGIPLRPVEHEIIMDRLEAGTYMLAAAATGGDIVVHGANAESMRVFLQVLSEMGHDVIIGEKFVRIVATKNARAVSFKTMPYPGFPTDLQAQTIAALCLSNGISRIEETVFENRLAHVRELVRMGAQINVSGNTAIVTGVERLYGTQVIGPDIRGAAGILIAALAANGESVLQGIEHLNRGYDGLIVQLQKLGALIAVHS